jgi:hypothetical protein
MAKVPDLSTYGAELALTTVSGVTRILIRPTQPKWRKDLADRFRPTGWLAWSNLHEGFVATRALRFGDLKVLFPNIQLVEGKIASAPAEPAAAPEAAVAAAERAEVEAVAQERESSAAQPEAFAGASAATDAPVVAGADELPSSRDPYQTFPTTAAPQRAPAVVGGVLGTVRSERFDEYASALRRHEGSVGMFQQIFVDPQLGDYEAEILLAFAEQLGDSFEGPGLGLPQSLEIGRDLLKRVDGRIMSASPDPAVAPASAERAEGDVVAQEGESSAAQPEARVEAPAAAPAAIGDAPADEAIEVSGYRVFPTQVRRPQGVETMWALESVDNKERRAKGLPPGIGDQLFETQAQASQGAELQARQQAERTLRAEREEQARQREAEVAAAAKADTVNGFVDDKLPMQAARMKEALGKQLRFDGVVMTVRERVESLHAAGKLTVETFEEPRVKPMSRLAFFRATQAEQSAHEKRMREAGTRTEYLVNGSVLGKTAYDYAQHLLGSAGVRNRDLDSKPDNADAERPHAPAATEASAPLEVQAPEQVSAPDDVAPSDAEDALKARAKALAIAPRSEQFRAYATALRLNRGSVGMYQNIALDERLDNDESDILLAMAEQRGDDVSGVNGVSLELGHAVLAATPIAERMRLVLGFSEGDQIRYAGTDSLGNAREFEGIAVQIDPTQANAWRVRVRTDEDAPQGGGKLTWTTYSNSGNYAIADAAIADALSPARRFERLRASKGNGLRGAIDALRQVASPAGSAPEFWKRWDTSSGVSAMLLPPYTGAQIIERMTDSLLREPWDEKGKPLPGRYMRLADPYNDVRPVEELHRMLEQFSKEEREFNTFAENEEFRIQDVEGVAGDPVRVAQARDALGLMTRTVAARREVIELAIQQAQVRQERELKAEADRIASRWFAPDLEALSKKPAAASCKGWMSGPWEGKTVWTNGHIVDLDGEPHLSGWKARTWENPPREINIGAVVPGTKPIFAELLAYWDAMKDVKADIEASVFFDAGGDVVSIGERYVRYMRSKYGADTAFGYHGGNKPLTVWTSSARGARMVGVVAQLRLTETTIGLSPELVRQHIAEAAVIRERLARGEQPADDAAEAAEAAEAVEADEVVDEPVVQAVRAVQAVQAVAPVDSVIDVAGDVDLDDLADAIDRAASERLESEVAAVEVPVATTAVAHGDADLESETDDEADEFDADDADDADDTTGPVALSGVDTHDLATVRGRKRSDILDDFGQRIGGARKDLYLRVGIKSDEWATLEETEQARFAAKPFVWPALKREQLVEAGTDPLVAFAITLLQKALPLRPANRHIDFEGRRRRTVWKDDVQPESLARFVRVVSALRDRMATVRTQEDMRAALRDTLTHDDMYWVRYCGNCNRKNVDVVKSAFSDSGWSDRLKASEWSDRSWRRLEAAMEHDDRIARRRDDDKTRAKERAANPAADGGDDEPSAREILADTVRSNVRFALKQCVGGKPRYAQWVSKDDRLVVDLTPHEAGQTISMQFMRSVRRRAYHIDQCPFNGTVLNEDAERYLLTAAEALCKDLGADAAAKSDLKVIAADEDVAKNLVGRVRVGPGWRDGNVTPEAFMETFGFRAGEFGHWVSGAERQAALDGAFDGLMDMASVFKMEPKQLGLNGTLAIAFGARGRGGQAAAHYEPGRRVINLTKTQGAGALAHEMGHALDHYLRDALCRQQTSPLAPFATEHMTKLIERMSGYQHYSGVSTTPEQALIRTCLATRIWWSEAQDVESLEAECLVALEKAKQHPQWDFYARALDKVLPGGVAILERPLEHVLTVHSSAAGIPQWQWGPLTDYARGLTAIRDATAPTLGISDRMRYGRQRMTTKSTYLSDAEWLDKDRKVYYTQPTELFARAIERVVALRLHEKGLRSDYLVEPYSDRTILVGGKSVSRFPQGAELARLATVMQDEIPMAMAFAEQANKPDEVDDVVAACG